MTKPRRKKPRAAPRASEHAVDELVGTTLAFLAGAALGKIAPPDAAVTCTNCGHVRADHCGCGKTCLWNGPLKRQVDGKMETQLCACAGFAPAAATPASFCGDGPLRPVLDLLGIRRSG